MSKCSKHDWEILGETRDDLGSTGLFKQCRKCDKKQYEHFVGRKFIKPFTIEEKDGRDCFVLGGVE